MLNLTYLQEIPVKHQYGESLDELAERLRHSDHEAFEAIFRQMNEPLLRFAYRFVRDKTKALDVLQDVFLKLWEKRETLEIKVSLSALLYTMARNRALNVNRQSARFKNDGELPQPNFSTRNELMGDTALNAQQLDAFFKAWIAELPPRRAEAFVLSRFHDLSHREISCIMGLSKRTVDTHIVHALKYLRTRYEALLAKGASS